VSRSMLSNSCFMGPASSRAAFDSSSLMAALRTAASTASSSLTSTLHHSKVAVSVSKARTSFCRSSSTGKRHSPDARSRLQTPSRRSLRSASELCATSSTLVNVRRTKKLAARPLITASHEGSSAKRLMADVSSVRIGLLLIANCYDGRDHSFQVRTY
jgi:Flp pilus assembly protein TadG